MRDRMNRVIISEAHNAAHCVTEERRMMKVMNRPPHPPTLLKEMEAYLETMTKSCLSPSRKNVLQECTEQISVHNCQVTESCRQRKLG